MFVTDVQTDDSCKQRSCYIRSGWITRWPILSRHKFHFFLFDKINCKERRSGWKIRSKVWLGNDIYLFKAVQATKSTVILRRNKYKINKHVGKYNINDASVKCEKSIELHYVVADIHGQIYLKTNRGTHCEHTWNWPVNMLDGKSALLSSTSFPSLLFRFTVFATFYRVSSVQSCII